MFKPLITDGNVFVLMNDKGNRLEVSKLEITPHDACLQTICFLELPPLMPDISVFVSHVVMEWVPTSKNYARSRSSRAGHTHFYPSTVGTMALYRVYQKSSERYREPSKYTIIIDVEGFLYAIRTGVRSVPWADWGPSSTHLFENTPLVPLVALHPAGPSWIMGISSPVLRQYYPRRMRYTQSMPEDTSSSGGVFSSTEVSDDLWDGCIETNMPYRDVMMDDLNFGGPRIMADREWVVRMTTTRTSEVREFCVYVHPQTGGCS
jgi:hypothetical protein